MLALGAPLPDEDAPPAPAPRQTRGKKRAERGRHREASAPARRRLALLGHWFGAEPADAADAPGSTVTDGERPSDPFETGVAIEEPMAGLGLVGAGVRALRDGTPRIDVVFHEWVGPTRERRSKALGRARYGVAILDRDGALVDDGRGSFGEADLFFGFLAGSLDPRLVATGAGSVLLAQASTRGPCQATVVTPGRAPMGPSRAGCALDPGRLLALAERARRPTKDRAARREAAARDEALEALAAQLIAEGAHRAEHQPAWDGPLAVAAGGRGYTRLDSGALVSFDRATGERRDEPTPLVARRARAFAAAIAPGGEALVRAPDGLREVSPTGVVTVHRDPLPPGAPRRDERAIAPAPFARIGATWWSTRGGPVRLAPPSATAPPFGEAPLQASVLVGGDERGMFLALDGAALVVASLDASGRAEELGRVRAPIGGAIDATSRGGGGAIVAGPAIGAPGRLATFGVSPDGAVGVVHRTLTTAAYGLAPRLAPLPGGGALLLGMDGRRHAWLGADGAVIAEGTSTPARARGCVDGVGVGATIPGASPGTTLEVAALGHEGTCVVGLPSWGRDGALRVVTSVRDGIDATITIASAPLPSSLLEAAPVARGSAPPPRGAPPGRPRCPPDMVLVDGRVCVDRFEAAIVEGATGRLASPDFPITPNLFAGALGDWATRRERTGDARARLIPLPRPRPFQLEGVTAPRATSRAGVLPSGYLTGLVAREVCAAAGKRLCTKDEFRTACRGERKTRFPYGEAYRAGVCNVGRDGHPAARLHDHASLGHLDPRLGRAILDADGPGLRPTGSHPACASVWEGDAIYDMVGNLDEWIDEEGGAFAGGFYARRTTSGCDALVDNHPPSYLDYSTGVRCCADPAPTTPPSTNSEPHTR
jgi:hypothetical protein